MAPKKKQQQNKPSSSKSKSKSQAPAGPRLQISAENENRLRRLLLNSDRSGPAPADDTLSKAQKAKKLRSVYEKLSCEGFSNDHIELALSALKEGATFESALDWLCLNLPGNELPLKFSSGTSLHTNEGGSIGIISTAREDWTPSLHSLGNIEDDEMSGISIRIKGRGDDDSLDLHQQSQADWIRQYVAQQEENESKTWEDDAVDDYSTKKVTEPRSYETIAKEYHAARLEALSAKEKGDKKGQEKAGHIIRKLKQELSALGLSDNSLESGFRYEHASGFASEDVSSTSMPEKHPEVITLCEVEGGSVMHPSESTFDGSLKECSSSNEFSMKSVSSSVPLVERIAAQESGDVELSNFFEDAPSSEVLPPEVLKLQNKEKMKELSSGKNLEKLEGIWKKGDPPKIPKAVLHQLCQRSGWEAPKFNKVVGKKKGSCYAVSVLRKSTGRGKSRKAGGLTTLELPDQLEAFESAEDAQNAVAAYALYQLFPDLPIHLAITEPYASFVIQWKEGESSIRIEESEQDRRAGFVNSLLDAGDSGSTAFVDVTDNSLPKKFQMLQIEENRNLNAAGPDLKPGRVGNFKEAESSYLKREHENKMKIGKYKDMLKTRSGLPIAEVKSEILQVLKEKNVLVVCGETGSGKTTQVPQFILDDMIEAGNGGFCNIICTQPRRIAVIHMVMGNMTAGHLYSRLIPLVLLLVDGSNPIDIDDPRWEIYLLVQKKAVGEEDFHYILLGFTAVYRFYHYPDSSRLRISQILVLPPYQHKGYGRYLLEVLYCVAISEDVHDLTVEEPLDYFQHVRTCVDTPRLLGFDPIQPAVNSVVSHLKETRLSKKSHASRLLPPLTAVEEVRKSLKINKKHFLHCWEVLIYLGLEPIEKYMENYTTFISDRIKSDIIGKDSETSGKRLIEVPSDYDQEMSFVMFRSQDGEASTIEMDESQTSQEEQLQKLVNERLEEIKLVAQKLSLR